MGELDDGYSRRRRRCRAATTHSAAVVAAPAASAAAAADGHPPLQIGGESSRARVEEVCSKSK